MRKRLPAMLLPALLLGTFLAYAPGLSGSFQFDDFANLNALGAFGGVDDWQAFWIFVLEGGAGPLGRPISLLSFVLNDVTWPPADAAPFLRTNVLLHLICGGLVCWLALLLARARGLSERKAGWVALTASALWLLHPFWVSTTLYVVQRMTILAALFSLAGLAAYVAARLRQCRGETVPALALLVLSMPVFGGLGILSKENAALLPLLILSLDATVLRDLRQDAGSSGLWRLAHWTMVRLPALAVAGYLAWKIPDFADRAAGYRPFSLLERLLTEGRVLLDYLFHIVVPQPQTAGLFHDDLVISQGPMEPPRTLAALIGVGMLALSAWTTRKRYPIAAMAVLFFFVGHLMESTVVPLELYFEHRNYLPAVGIFIAAGFGLVQLARITPPVATVAGGGAVALLALMTVARASLWGDPLQLSLVWAEEAPASVRARTVAALALYREGRPIESLRQVEAGLDHRPLSIELQLHRRILQCRLGIRDETAFRELGTALRGGYYTFTSYKGLKQYMNDVRSGLCRNGSTMDEVLSLIDLARSNAKARGRAAQSNLYHLEGMAHLYAGNQSKAVAAFNRAMSLDPTPGLGLNQAAFLATHHKYDAALQMLDRAEAAPENGKRSAFTARLTGMDTFHRDEIERLRKLISSEQSARDRE